ncbi:hypothetical protein [Flavobacterium sp. J27]|uniref:hypothetical protein n=1 Tax=Flavobacterium sp. J27 TaxID=2060419 RepID=UPI001031CC45|nr:hypothetical protein [Flavobacterium sp. J27]
MVITNLTFWIYSLFFAQNYLLPNEELIFGFETQRGKKLVLAKDKNNAYIIYRFGTIEKLVPLKK